MTQYRLCFAKSVAKDLDALDATLNRRILKKIEALPAQPRPAGCVKLTGFSHRWRLRVGDYRIVYDLDEKNQQIDVIAVRHRRDIYRILH